jgi:hypothetical protein
MRGFCPSGKQWRSASSRGFVQLFKISSKDMVDGRFMNLAPMEIFGCATYMGSTSGVLCRFS